MVRGHLTLRTTPEGADVVINGASLGRSPIRGQTVRSSTPLRIRVTRDGYLPEDSEVSLEQLKQGVRLYFELTPFPPLNQCTGEQGGAWLQLLPRTSLPFDSLDALRLCFAKDQNWSAVVTVVSLMLAEESRGALYYDRAQAGYNAGGLENYHQCALDAESARRFGGLGRCQLWRTQHLRLVCLLNYENHLRRPRDRAVDLPSQRELFEMLQNDLDNADPGGLTEADRVCHDNIREKVKTMRTELKR